MGVHRAAGEAPQLDVVHRGGRARAVPRFRDDIDPPYGHQVVVVAGAILTDAVAWILHSAETTLAILAGSRVALDETRRPRWHRS